MQTGRPQILEPGIQPVLTVRMIYRAEKKGKGKKEERSLALRKGTM